MSVIRRITLGVVTLILLAAVATIVTAWHQGYHIYIVHTGSMMPTLRPGDAVLDRPAPRAVGPGEIVTFTVHSGPDSVVTHRVASVTDGAIKTKGDANRSVDPWTVQAADVVGSTQAALPKMGYVLVYLRHPQGALSVITVGFGLMLLWQLFFTGTPSDSAADTTSPPADERISAARARHRRTRRSEIMAANALPTRPTPDSHHENTLAAASHPRWPFGAPV